MRLSPLAEAVLKDHRTAPNDHFFDLAIFGSMFPSESIERLQAAYDELEAAGLMERSGDFEELFGRVLALYRLTNAGLRDGESGMMLESDSVLILGSFASGLYRHFENFRKTKGYPQELLAEIRLANGHSFLCNGLWISHLDEVAGCVMVHGTPAQSEKALVIREEHIVSAEFSVKPPTGETKRQPFGFAAGSSAQR